MRRWLLVRHAESVANAGRWFSGHTDVPLSERGEAQARALGDELGEVARVVTSDLRRAWDTAQIALGGRPVD
ncbi:MAG TPA: histidine phosphatase family protein, partial [Myxococcota bacterium]|nr:histidine phosphatase family protein [Myxococcota bacterium]